MIKKTVLSLAFIIGMLIPFYVYGWAGHMQWVRDLQTMQVEHYKDSATDWSTVDSEDHDLIIELARNEFISISLLGIGGIRDQVYQLRDELSNMMYLINSHRNKGLVADIDAINHQEDQILKARQDLYEAHIRFQTNWFFAMMQTF